MRLISIPAELLFMGQCMCDMPAVHVVGGVDVDVDVDV